MRIRRARWSWPVVAGVLPLLSACGRRPGFETERRAHHAFRSATPVFVNELHYENAGRDAAEAVEIVGPAGSDLSGWSLVLYNGQGGQVYATHPLSGVIDGGGRPHGATLLALSENGVQNGSPDGLALVDAQGAVRQWLSYEGSFTAEAGPAQGLLSSDLGVQESQHTVAGMSLQLVGVGSVLTDFAWVGPRPASFGQVNDGQTLLAGADAAPELIASQPAVRDAIVLREAPLRLEFSEPVAIALEGLSLACAEESLAFRVRGGPVAFMLEPELPLPQGTRCTLRIAASGVWDLDDDDPPDALVVDHLLTFQVPLAASIGEVQGAGHRSPLLGQFVIVSGVVTAAADRGFYLQSLAPDADPATSEGLYVFTAGEASVTPGDLVEVAGLVHEHRPGCDECGPGASAYANSSITEITAPNQIRVVSSGHGLPQATVIGEGGRQPPGWVIDEPEPHGVEVSEARFNPVEHGLDFYESLESMWVAVNDAVAVGPTTTFGEIAVVADAGRQSGQRTPRGGLVVRRSDFNPERILIDDALVPDEPKVHVGARFEGPIRGVLSYAYGNYKLLNTEPLVLRQASSLQREYLEFAELEPGQVDVATLNVQNLSAKDASSRFRALAAIVVDHLRAPGIVVLQEVQDDSGATDDGVVEATGTLTLLARAIEQAGGPSYLFAEIPPEDGQDGGRPGGNIRQAFLYAPERGITLVGRPGDAFSATQVVVGRPVHLRHSPGRIEPEDPAFLNSRKPLVAEFLVEGESLFVVANHFNSKSSDEPLFGRFQPPELRSQNQRLEQAAVVRGFVEELTAADPRVRLVVMGDLNDLPFSPALQVLSSAGLVNPLERMSPAERYTYIHDGNSQALDHVLLSSGALRRGFALDIVHVNAEFCDRVTDHDPVVVRLRLR